MNSKKSKRRRLRMKTVRRTVRVLAGRDERAILKLVGQARVLAKAHAELTQRCHEWTQRADSLLTAVASALVRANFDLIHPDVDAVRRGWARDK
jgi:hypothetical protein